MANVTSAPPFTRAQPDTQQPPPPQRRPQIIRAQRTATKPVEFRAAIERAHKELTGENASPELLDVLAAHVSHETASGTKMYNFNFGGIKGSSPDGLSARYNTTEVMKGRRHKIKDGFRAYRTLDDGARDYLALMQKRYGKALGAAARGDVAGFSGALKERGYYTDSPTNYTRGLTRRIKADGEADWAALPQGALNRAYQIGTGSQYLYGAELAAEFDTHGLPPTAPTAAEVARVLDSVNSLTSRIVQTEEEPTDIV